MQGFRRTAIHLALVALLLRAFLPAGWMPGGPGDAPLVMCGLSAIHDTADGKEVPAKTDSGGDCAFATVSGLPAPEMAAIPAPGLLIQYRHDEPSLPAPASAPRHARPAPRAPPALT